MRVQLYHIISLLKCFKPKRYFAVSMFKMYCLYFVVRNFYVKKQIIINPLLPIPVLAFEQSLHTYILYRYI